MLQIQIYYVININAKQTLIVKKKVNEIVTIVITGFACVKKFTTKVHILIKKFCNSVVSIATLFFIEMIWHW